MPCEPIRGASTPEIVRQSQQAPRNPAARWRANSRKSLILVALLVTFDGACHKSSAPETSPTSSSVAADFWLSKSPVITGHAVKLSDLSESEVRFGIAPKRGPGVTYQDGIILMEHGDQAIRSFASDGMSWTFDANAPQVNEIQVGKVLFATDRCAGKVLAVQRNGDSVTAILGPVQLNELVKEGNFAYNQPLDLNNAIAVVAPDYPAALGSKALQEEAQKPSTSSRNDAPHSYQRSVSYYVVSNDGHWTPMRTLVAGGSPRLLDATYHPAPPITRTALQTSIPGAGAVGSALGQAASAPVPVPVPQLKQLTFNNLQATPCALDCGGIGAKVYQEKDGVKVWASIIFHLNSPHIVFNASISGNGVNADVQLFGGAGVTITVDAATGNDFASIQGNIKELGLIPAEINVPIGGLLVPLTAKLSQSLDITSGFSAKNSVLHGEGSLDLDGSIEAWYHAGHGWRIEKPTATVKNNLAGLISGESMGINSFIFAFNQRLMVGVGALGFAAGPYVDLLTTLTTLKQSSATWADCRQATFEMSVGAGIGYSMPKVVANVINAVLGLFGVKPIPSWGSIVALPKRVDLVNRIDMVPEKCAGH
ncbi:MAG TPA: hypothetical protein VH596_11750 [Terriglobales bacterium]|jgi:hypothetical protein